MTSGLDEPVNDAASTNVETSVGVTATGDDKIRSSRDEDLDGFNADDVVRVRSYDPITIAMAGSFGGFIPGVVEAANATLVRTTELHGEFSTSNGGGTMEEYFREAFDMPSDGEKDDDDDDAWQDYAEAHEEERREREREEWGRTEHSLAGVHMTGDEWEQLADDIAPNGRLRRTLVQWYMKHGKTQAEAEKKATEDEEIYHIQAKPESQRTPDEQRRVDKANVDPEFRSATSFLATQREKGFSVGNEALENASTGGTDNVSVAAGANVFNADEGAKPQPMQPVAIAGAKPASGAADFPSAPDLTEHHQAALAATVPLDAPKPPTTVASIAPAPGSGFDL